jgi:phosphoribosyl 1,2-cyclic phosphodiesterase
VTHRGPTLGYRITEGDVSVCYIPDHEPALGVSLRDLDPDWISGFDLARGADLLIHDCQYADNEYAEHVGWGHSAVSHTVALAWRTEAKRLLLFHHDPLHADDYLDRLGARAQALFAGAGGDPAAVRMATEGTEIELGPRSPAALAAG